MNITARIVADSITPAGNRLTSFIFKYPRFIHAEILTHRAFSRNSASSRAIPFKKTVEAVMSYPAMPEYWGLNAPGMKAKGCLEGPDLERAQVSWLELRDSVVGNAEFISKEYGLHKQLVNRLIETWMHITVLVTCSEEGLLNFFGLRAHKDAQPEFQVLAFRALDKYLHSIPRRLDWGDWHLPFGDRCDDIDIHSRLKVVTARAARISYLTFEGNASVEDDCRLHDQLLDAGHMSPFEHAAEANDHVPPGSSSNFGPYWLQYRKTFTADVRTPDLRALMAAKPDWVTLEG